MTRFSTRHGRRGPERCHGDDGTITLWALGMENAITPDLDVSFVGPYHPVTFSFDGYRRRVRPADLAGWDTPIMSPDHPTRDSSSQQSGDKAR